MIDKKVEQLHVKNLTAEDISIAASLIYQAYHDDPILQTLFNYQPDTAKNYEKKLRSLIREELNSFWQEKQPLIGLYNNERLKAVTCLFSANSELQAERFWHWRLKLMLSAGYIQTNQLIKKEKTIRDELNRFGNYYYLAFIAVDPHFQGQGYGRALLQALDDLLNTNPTSSGFAVFVTRHEHNAFFASEGFEYIKKLEFNHVSGQLLFKSVK
ncbi:GNAT family N-acetyltransferase [Pseudoalteromonas sp. MMG010]|uniref:GNAT family N-acetyltransferase n=1 Tax=Pseudoalteromonas sp. MMG010 TaxID=2822685 RepID=UPI001B3A2DC2|nr:GNAT family N-acetyltransferase [Pseudoalteromonas sp. MMG010]MBQ4831653.1 GNAT family N-acetyltransferase [Pseudoalteromonas sp. MMG010]